MPEHSGNHPLASVPGVFTIAVWSLYVLAAVLYFPEFPPSVLAAGFFGVAACLALVFNFKYWRSTVVLASSLYLLLYAIRIIRMTAITPDLPFSSALSFYYSMSWRVTTGMFQEKGVTGGLAQAFLEYVMPVLAVILIVVILMSRRSKPGAARAS